jgi:hypothetical protein
MSHTAIIDLLVLCAAVFGVAAFVGLILAPAWSTGSRLWERIAATFLSLYVFVVLVGIGAVAALAVIYLAT